MTVEAPEPHDLASLLTSLDHLRQAERRAASARMVSVAGHLVGTPLNVIAGRAALIRSNPTPEAVEENVRRIEEQVERLAQRIRRLIDFFGLSEPKTRLRSLGDVLSECEALYAPVAARKSVELELAVAGFEAMRVDGELALLVLTTLLSLGVRSSSAGQRVAVSVQEHGPSSLIVELEMPGLEAPPKSFERLEPPEHGVRYDAGALETLWVCLGLSRRSGGGLTVQPRDGGGVRVRFECPCS